VSEQATEPADRDELTEWLLSEGFTAEQVSEAFAPTLLPSRRALGDDGTRLSARQISAQWGVDLASLQRILHAAGRPRTEDADAALYLPVDSDLIGYAQPRTRSSPSFRSWPKASPAPSR
jgi:adenylate cyclase